MAQSKTRRSTPTGILLINKKPWAVELQWNSAATLPEARTLALQRMGKTFSNAVFRTASDGTAQFGLGIDAKGHKIGVPSLAAAFCGSVPYSWFAAFPLEDDAERYYVIASRNGVIDPLTDKVLAESPAVELYRAIQEGLGSHNAMVPEHWGVDGSVARSLSEVVATELKQHGKLQPINRKAALTSRLTRIAIGAAALGLCYYGYLWMSTPQGDAVPPQQLDLDPPPWANKENGVEAARICLDAMNRLPESGPGWNRVAIACQDGSASGVYTREKSLDNGGTPFSWFMTVVKDGGWPTQGLKLASPTGDRAVYEMPVPVAKDHWTAALKPPSIASQSATLANRFDRAFLPVTTTAGGDKYYKTMTIAIHSKANPSQYLNLFDGILGITLESVTYTASGWDLKMQIGQAERLPQGYFINNKPPPPVRQFDKTYAAVYNH